MTWLLYSWTHSINDYLHTSLGWSTSRPEGVGLVGPHPLRIYMLTVDREERDIFFRGIETGKGYMIL